MSGNTNLSDYVIFFNIMELYPEEIEHDEEITLYAELVMILTVLTMFFLCASGVLLLISLFV